MLEEIKALVRRAVERNLLVSDDEAQPGVFTQRLVNLLDQVGGHPESPYGDRQSWVMLLPDSVVTYFLGELRGSLSGKTRLVLWVGRKGHPLLGAY